MTPEQFKNNMATIRTALKNATGSRATVLCMVVAATRGHVHAKTVWARLDGWRDRGKDVGTLEGQRAFVAMANFADPWGARPLTPEEVETCLATVDAADAYRASWAERLAEQQAVAAEKDREPVAV